MNVGGRAARRATTVLGMLLLALPAILLAASSAAPDAVAGGVEIEREEDLGRIVVEVPSGAGGGGPLADLDGRALMERVHARHEQYPFVFEELSMVLIDRNKDRHARRLRRFSRVETDGTTRLLLLFDTPSEVEGVGLLASLGADGVGEVGIYLPALGPRLVRGAGDSTQSAFLGTDFSVENFVGEILDDYRYVRRRTRSVEGVPHHVVDVFDARDDPRTARALRRHFVRADILFITLTEHFDEFGKISKRQTTHDLQQVDGRIWRGNMILMEDFRDGHQTLVKIDRRVFSRDYVPAEMFTESWLVANHPPPERDADASVPATPDEVPPGTPDAAEPDLALVPGTPQ